MSTSHYFARKPDSCIYSTLSCVLLISSRQLYVALDLNCRGFIDATGLHFEFSLPTSKLPIAFQIASWQGTRYLVPSQISPWKSGHYSTIPLR